MWDVQRTAVCVKGLGGALAVGGSPDLRAVRREGAAWGSEKPFRCSHSYGTGGLGTRGRGHLGSVRARIPPMVPRNCDRYHVPHLVRWGRCVDEKSKSACRVPPRSANVLGVACVDRFSTGTGRWLTYRSQVNDMLDGAQVLRSGQMRLRTVRAVSPGQYEPGLSADRPRDPRLCYCPELSPRATRSSSS